MQAKQHCGSMSQIDMGGSPIPIHHIIHQAFFKTDGFVSRSSTAQEAQKVNGWDGMENEDGLRICKNQKQM
jgi:hypothetical protein